MKKIILMLFLSLVLIECKKDKKTSDQQPVDKTANADIPTAEVFYSSDTIRPGNMAITSTGRIFITTNPQYEDYYSVRELNAETQEIKPYPNAAYVSGENPPFKKGIGVRVDSEDNLWLLELIKGEIHIWDTKNEKLIKVIKLGKETFYPNSFLQDFIIDEKHQRLVIADMTMPGKGHPTRPAFIVVDLNTDKSVRILENTKYLIGEVELGGGVNPIDIDENQEWLYFGPMLGSKMYRGKAELLNDPEAFEKSVEVVGEGRDYADGMIYAKGGKLYIGDVQDNVIGKLENGVYTEVAKLPEGQSWPDGFSIYQGYVYCTVNQLSKSAHFLDNTEDTSTPPYTIVRIKLD